ncbi:prepilin-type N-terminal cleavage/methylation domain-containing protein [Shewanella maritima]|uniref:prepilin-type N-terminal cleavage/methylation domain-containing protein n=1 Tax=Shewanella maritima TaxID=2520507 RepID=UPI0037366FC3
MLGRYRHLGFTIIELVVVIIILAIIAVVAASKLLDFRRDAEINRVKAVAASYQQSLTFAHTRWLIVGNSGPMNDLPGFANDDLDMNAEGYPLGVDKGNPMGNPRNIGQGGQGCVDLWNSLLEGPPSVSLNSVDNGSDFQSFRHVGEIAGVQSQCTYVLRTLGDESGRRRAEISIVYDSIAGTAKPVFQ